MLLKTIVDDIAYQAGASNDPVMKRKIETDVLSAYATIVRRAVGSRTGDTNRLRDSILVNLEDTQEPEVPKTSLYNKAIKKSVTVLPNIIVARQQDCGYQVTSKNGEISFTYIRPERMKHRKRSVSRFISDNPPSYFTVLGRYLYVYDTSKVVRVTAIFSNPKEIAVLKRTDKTQDLAVQIDDDLYDGIKKLIFETANYSPIQKEAREFDNINNEGRTREVPQEN